MSIIVRSALIIVLCAVAPMRASAQCSAIIKAEENGLLNRGGKLGAAVIFGKPTSVPQLRLRFINDKTGQVVKPKKVTVTYPWQWLEYPYPEHLWGAWSDAYDFLTCSLHENEEELLVPAYEVTPRGWYQGKYTNFPWSRKPKFDGIGIKVEESGCSSSLGIKKSDLSRYQNAIAVVRLSCPATPKVTFMKP